MLALRALGEVAAFALAEDATGGPTSVNWESVVDWLSSDVRRRGRGRRAEPRTEDVSDSEALSIARRSILGGGTMSGGDSVGTGTARRARGGVASGVGGVGASMCGAGICMR